MGKHVKFQGNSIIPDFGPPNPNSKPVEWVTTTGEKYEETRHLSTAEVAQLVRADLKAAGIKASVRVARHGGTIDVDVKYEPLRGLPREKVVEVAERADAILQAYNQRVASAVACDSRFFGFTELVTKGRRTTAHVGLLNHPGVLEDFEREVDQ